MSYSEYPIIQNLFSIKNSSVTEPKERFIAVKKVLTEYANESGMDKRTFNIGTFNVIFENDTPEFFQYIQEFLFESEINSLYEIMKENKSQPDCLNIMFILSHDLFIPILKEKTTEIMESVLGADYEPTIEKLKKQLIAMMTDVFSEYPNWHTAATHKTTYIEHYSNKYKNTIFEKTVEDFILHNLCRIESKPLKNS